jgi:hypothetical protein
MLAKGQRITRYLGRNSASLDLGNGKHGVLESSVPIATSTSSGRAVPIDLRLRRTNGGFEPSVASSRVLIHGRADAGVTFTDSGLSIAPAQSGSDPSGSPDGGGVLYANTQIDTDTLLKPVAQGVAVDAVLRSAASPQRLSFVVSGPGRVRLSQKRSGIVSVTIDGDAVATVQPPRAQDAAGAEVPVTMSVSGSRLVLDVAHRDGDFQYPIEVDPVAEDHEFLYSFTWHVGTNNPSAFSFGISGTTGYDGAIGTYSGGQWGAWGYKAPGVSRIEAIDVEATSSDPGNDIESRALIAGEATGIEGQEVGPSNYGPHDFVVRAAGSAGNSAEFGQWATNVGSSFLVSVYKTDVRLVQESSPTVEPDTTDLTLEGHTNVTHTGGWLGPLATTGVFGIKAHDAGIGVHEITVRSPQAPGWESKPDLCWWEVECPQDVTGTVYGASLPDGKDTLNVIASNAAHGDTATTMEVKVDNTAPHDVSISGLPANAEIGDSVYKLRASASDGTGTTLSSGVKPLSITIDGIPFGTPQGGCTVGPCTATGEWTISGGQFAVGQHQMLLTAADYAGSTTTKEMTFFVTRPVTPISAGPGSVNPESGELTLRPTDVSVGAASGPLTVARGYGSEHLTDGVEGPLGPNWTLDLGGVAESVVKLPTGSVLLDSGDGLKSLFTPKAGGEYTAPNGDANLKLVESTVEGKVQFQLSTVGATTTFKLPAGGTGNTWVPASESEPNGTNVTTFSYQVAGSVIEPTEVLAPVPANVTCTGTLVRGCRALRFVYASESTEKGPNASEWGDFTGRLKEVTFTAWDPSTSAMSTTAVAQYSYDNLGRLRAEWDPRISPALKTSYGYDVEGHVTSLLPAGEQPWLVNYGTVAGDIRTGRMLSVTRPAPTTAAGTGVTSQVTVLPALSSTNASEGQTLTVTTGTWSNAPLAYGYQWKECQTVSGRETCTPILGATNASYRSVYRGPNRWLKAFVTAINSNGATTTHTLSTNVVFPNSYMTKSIEFGTQGSGNGQLNNPSGIATDLSGNVWVADTANNRVEKFSASGAFMGAYGTLGSGILQFKGPTGISIDSAGTVWVADTGNDRIEALTSTGAFAGASTTGVGTAPRAIAATKVGGEHMIYLGVSNNSI